jgi:hypothetical protein
MGKIDNIMLSYQLNKFILLFIAKIIYLFLNS